jgi:hypothetical protein
MGEAYITWLYPLGVITFSDDLLFIGRFNAKGPLETSYHSETYRKSSMVKGGKEYEKWMDETITYWRFVENEDVELAVQAQRGFSNGVLGRGRLHSVEGMHSHRSPYPGLCYHKQFLGRGKLIGDEFLTVEHAVKWYQDKVREVLVKHAELEEREGKNVDFAVPREQRQFVEEDRVCKLLGNEFDW